MSNTINAQMLDALQAIADCCEEDHAARDYASRQTEIRGIARAALAAAEAAQAAEDVQTVPVPRVVSWSGGASPYRFVRLLLDDTPTEYEYVPREAAQVQSHVCGNDTIARACQDAADEIERLRGIVPEVLERLNDELCAENDRLREALQAPQAQPAAVPSAAVLLAEQVLHMDMVTERGKRARELARQVLDGAHDVHEGECAAVLRELASWLSAGGFNAPAVNPAIYRDKIRWGVDELVKAAQAQPAAVPAQGEPVAAVPAPTAGRWYVVDRNGVAMVCKDEDDAHDNAAESFVAYPHNGPYTVAQLVPLAQAQREPLSAAARDVLQRCIQGIDHLAELARLWEPDHSSGADRRGWVLARDARDDASRLLATQPAAAAPAQGEQQAPQEQPR